MRIMRGKGGLYSAESTINLNSWGTFVGYSSLATLRRAVIRKIRADYKASDGGYFGWAAEYSLYHRDVPGGVRHLVGVYRATKDGYGGSLVIQFGYAGFYGRIYRVK